MNPSLKDIFAEAKHIVTKANAAGLKIGTAESCTGGLIGAAITAIPGSSNCFNGGIIAYDNKIKQTQLNVPPKLLASFGAVSQEVAVAMASNSIDALGVDIAVSVTGIAGPGGGSAEKPVGLVFIGIAIGSYVKIQRFEFGDIGRNKVRDQTCYEALKILHIAVESMLKKQL